MAYFIGNKEVTEAEWRQQNAAATGAQQIGSQFWMDSNYHNAGLPDPAQNVKEALSTADYARDWIGRYSETLVAAGADVSPAVAAIARTYPVSESSIKLWNEVPAISPLAAVEQRIAESGGIVQWQENMGIVTANPNTVNNPNSPLAPGSPVSGAGAGSIDPYQVPTKYTVTGSGSTGGSGESSTESGGILSLLGTYGIYILAGIIALLFILLVFGKGSRSGSVAA